MQIYQDYELCQELRGNLGVLPNHQTRIIAVTANGLFAK